LATVPKGSKRSMGKPWKGYLEERNDSRTARLDRESSVEWKCIINDRL